ncbi:MAG: hypothetical protein GY793_01870 [Proteobacteria bacterium]|nr:hypothetical protein [Pseudomonadota bacterium]
MYNQISLFDETVDLWIDKLNLIKGNNNFTDIKITDVQAKLFPFYYKMTRKVSEHYIRIYHTGHFKGEITILSHGPDGCSNQFTNHDNGDFDMIQGLKKVYEVIT